LAAPTLRQEDIDPLEKTLEQFAKALKLDDYQAYFELDRAFHEQLVSLSGNSKLQELFQLIDSSIQVTRWMHCDSGEISELALIEHRRIRAALRVGNRGRSA